MKGSIEFFDVQSAALEGNPLKDPSRRRTPIYLPPGYAAGSERLPTVYFLHAFSNSALSWLNAQAFIKNVPERLDALVEAGALPPFIGVFVDGWTSLGGSQWVNSDAIGRYREYVAKDVVPQVDKKFRTLPAAASRAVVGHSSGGYGAFVMARYHSDVFGHLGCHSGDSGFEYCYQPDIPKVAGVLLKAGGVEAWWKEFNERCAATKPKGDDFMVVNLLAMAAAYSPKKGDPLGSELPFDIETARLKTDVWTRWLVNDPVRFVPKNAEAFKRLKSVFLDCGTRDEANLRWGTRMVAEELKKLSIEHVHEEFDDGHSGVGYRFERSLGYLVPRLTRPA